MPIKINCSWDLSFEIDSKKNVELYVDYVPQTPNPDVVRFVWLLEPPGILDLSRQVEYHKNNYDYILTHQDDILKSEKSHLFEFGGCWVKDYEHKDKKNGVSCLIGGKTSTGGHRLRHSVFYNRGKLPNVQFFNSKNFPGPLGDEFPIISDSKVPLFNYKFSIIIENESRENWFSEKLIDCLYTKTIPIYWGCKNIDKWFNINGMLLANSFEDILHYCNNLPDYSSFFQLIEENYNKCLEFTDIPQRLKKKIEFILNDKE